MSLYESFLKREPTQDNKKAIETILDSGLSMAEEKTSTEWSGSFDLCRLLKRGSVEPDWLNQNNDIHPELVATYRDWIEKNRSRIEAVLGKN